MNPEARCGSSLVVYGFVESCDKEVVDDPAILGNAVDTFANLEVYLAIAGLCRRGCISVKFIGSIDKADTRIFIAVKKGVQVEVAYVKTSES